MLALFGGCGFESSSRFSNTNFILQFSQNKTGEYEFIVHSNEFYTQTIYAFRYNTCTSNFYTKYGRKKTLSLKGNDKAISILQNVIKVMVV